MQLIHAPIAMNVLLVFLLIGLSAFFAIVWFQQHRPGLARFIVLNGTSSSGKTAIALHLKKILGDQCIIVRVDDVIHDIIRQRAFDLEWDGRTPPWHFLRLNLEQKIDDVVFDSEIRARMLNLELFYDRIREVSRTHRYVVIDTVFETIRDSRELHHLLYNRRVTWALVYCPLSEIERRISSRNSGIERDDYRILFAVYESFANIFGPSKTYVTVPLEVLKKSEFIHLFDNASHDLITRVPTCLRARYVQKLKEFRKIFFEKFNIDDAADEVSIYPLEKYQVIVNTQESAEKCAERIAQRIIDK